jgi:RimJ/RimL family protein N-acetyltransferase
MTPPRRPGRDTAQTPAAFFLFQALLGLFIAVTQLFDRPLRVLDWVLVALGLLLAVVAFGGWRQRRRASRPVPPVVRLRPIDDDVLARLVAVAQTDARPDEVTPPLTPGDTWTRERIEWLHRFHSERRSGLDGPHGEATGAVEASGSVVGAVRLKRLPEPGVLETGIWLTRGARGSGVGRAALEAVLDRAAAWGSSAVRADTSQGNHAAQGLLRALGFVTRPAGDRVEAMISTVGRRPPVS